MTPVRRSVSINLLAVLVSLTAVVQAVAEEATPAPTFKPEELEQIVAPIALYPDAVLAQVFMASTYPLEIVQAARWSKDHPDVKGDALQAEMQKQSWDASVKSLTTFPDVLAMMNEKLDWTQKLGDAFLAQQKDVMDAVQRLRAKAKAEGNLESSKEQVVRTEAAPAGASTSTIIYVEPSDPQVVYVPTYNPTVVYGAWPYPAYPPYYYYPPGYVAATSFFSFTFGVAVGSALWGNCNWGHSDIDIDVNRQNNFNNINTGDNELRTIQACLAFVDAEREYYQRNPENDPLLHYARRLLSSEGRRDGLYFEVNPGEPESPLGISFANARDEGYFAEGAPQPQPFHGYVYRVLTAQGADAAGGAYDYLAGDRMIGGFALIAYPADYGSSGVMTFVVNHDGVVFSKDLGAETVKVAGAITEFNPDSSWKREASI